MRDDHTAVIWQALGCIDILNLRPMSHCIQKNKFFLEAI